MQESHVYDAPFQVLQMPSWSISSLFHIQTIPNNNDKNRAITSYRAIPYPLKSLLRIDNRSSFPSIFVMRTRETTNAACNQTRDIHWLLL